MDKKTSIIVIVIGVIILALIMLAFGLEKNTVQLTSEDVLRINNEVYKKEEFEKYIIYTLYKNNGELKIDEDEHAEDLESGVSRENLFISDTLNSFYQLKVFDILAREKNIVVDAERLEKISGDYNENKDKITSAGLSQEDYTNIEKQNAIIEMVSNNPTQYIKLPDEVYNEYINQFSGDDLKSYTYRMLQVGYTADKISGDASGDASGDVSGEVIKGDKEEKEAYVNTLVARINAGESFEAVAESGDNRLIFTGTGIEFAKSIEEYSAGFLLEQKLGGSEEASEIVKKTEAGKLSEVIDTGDVFQLVLVEKVEDGVVGKAKDELVELLISQYANELIYQVVKDMEVNNAAVSRITIK